MVAFLVFLSIPGMAAGWGLMKFRSWARILALVLSILALILFPFGTLVGIYGLWVLLTRKPSGCSCRLRRET